MKYTGVAFSESDIMAMRGKLLKVLGAWLLLALVAVAIQVLDSRLRANPLPAVIDGRAETPGQARLATSLPADFPHITITVPADGTGDGFVFLSALNWPPATTKATYLMILDDNAQPVYYQRVAYDKPPALLGYDFKMQPKGTLTYFDRRQGKHIELNDRYEVINTWEPKNDFREDHHDLQLLPGGRNFLLAFDERVMNLSRLAEGGKRDAKVLGIVVQEQNDQQQVVWEWSGWDDFKLADSSHTVLSDTLVDYVHGNSIVLDTDGNIIISSRNLDEVTKIDYQTRKILWRLGGQNNQFTFVNDPRGFSWQHDVRRLPNGNLTLFDNGVYHDPQYSRGVEYQIDETNKVITLVQEFRLTPDVYADAMANLQRLPNGNTLIGWGTTLPTLTEFRPDGSKAFEFTLPPATFTYRVFRFPWRAQPTTPPVMDAETLSQTVRLTFSWNGATHTQFYRVFAGRAPSPATAVYSATRTAFESEALLSGLTRGIYYFRAQAVDDLGHESDFSNEISVTVTDASVYVPVLRRS